MQGVYKIAAKAELRDGGSTWIEGTGRQLPA